jgi:hypothetical protein
MLYGLATDRILGSPTGPLLVIQFDAGYFRSWPGGDRCAVESHRANAFDSGRPSVASRTLTCRWSAAAFGQINRRVFRRRLSTQYRERFQVKALWPISVNVRAIRTCFQELSLSFALTVFCLPQRPLVGRGTWRDRLTSYLRLKYGRFEPSNPSVDVFQGIGIHR